MKYSVVCLKQKLNFPTWWHHFSGQESRLKLNNFEKSHSKFRFKLLLEVLIRFSLQIVDFYALKHSLKHLLFLEIFMIFFNYFVFSGNFSIWKKSNEPVDYTNWGEEQPDVSSKCVFPFKFRDTGTWIYNL